MKKGDKYLAFIRSRIEERIQKTPPITLSEWRAHNGFTQETLASALRVNIYTVKKWEGGDREPIGFLGLALSAVIDKIQPTKIDNSKTEYSLAEWRKRRQFTQEALAAALNVNVNTVKKWEGGTRNSIDFLGLALSAIDANLVPVGIRFERRLSQKNNNDDVPPAPNSI